MLLTVMAINDVTSVVPVAWLLEAEARRVPNHGVEVGKERVVVVQLQKAVTKTTISAELWVQISAHQKKQ